MILTKHKKSKASFNVGWGRIFSEPTIQGSIYLLPSKNDGVIIQYEPDFRISCLLPPASHDVEIEWKGNHRQRTIECPTLLMSQLLYKNNAMTLAKFAQAVGKDGLCKCDICSAIFTTLNHHAACYCNWCDSPRVRQNRVTQIYYLYALDPNIKGDIVAQPFRLTNVYEDAKICFRKERSSVKMPKNLRQANSSFWMNRFDNDFNWGVPHICKTRSHQSRYCKKTRQKHICVSGRPGYGDDEVKAAGHKHYHHICNEKSFRPTRDRCDCCRLRCMCYAQCGCCAKTCDCPERWPLACKCQCCKNTCNCACLCDLTEHFADMIQNYKPEDDKWESIAQAVCGRNFFASPKKATGVFVSFDDQLMHDIPKELWRYSNRHSCSMVLGVAKQKKHGSWTIDLGNFDFSLSPDQICLIN